MKCKNINDIVIVGGGSAGWMVAATLISQFPNKKITVLESKNIPTVGVGESTVGGIRGWLNVVGIEDHQFMPHCDAVYKLAIKFTDFYESNSGSWYYPFGHPAADYKDWFIKKALYPNTSSEDFAETLYPQMQLVKENRILNSIEKKLSPWQLEHSAFHFDAAKFGEWLRKNYCLPKNVTHKTGTIVNCSMSENGIERLLLDNNEDMTADLYIDCTGFQALLIDKYLKTPFHSYEDILPNNRAWAARIPYTNKEKQLTLHTECTAIDYGWIWNIPLWSRIGTGLVYSDKFLDPLAAKTKFLNYLRKNHNAENIELKDIKMRVGTHEKYWNKNVVAIGLSAAFIEPLESTGLVTVHDWAIELCKTLERGSVSQWDIDEYNKTCRDQFEYWSQFVSMHYALSHRTDSDYWQYVTSEHLIDKRDKLSNLQSQNLWHQSIYQKRYKFELPDDYGVRCLAAGMNWNPINTVTLKSN
jgi:tryptophan halogenase